MLAQQMFVDLLCARHCLRDWRYSGEQNRQNMPAVAELKCVAKGSENK